MIFDCPKFVYHCRVHFTGDPENNHSGNDDLTRSIERSYNEEDTTNIVENNGKTNEAFLTGRYCPDLPGENDPVCTACEELEESYKELCLIDPCLMAREVDRGQCYSRITELLKT